MHTSVTEIVQESDGRSVSIEMRLFADDLAQAIGAAHVATGSDSLISAYVRRGFVLADAGGSPVPLEWVGAETVGDVVRIRLNAPVHSLAGFRIIHAVLCERFEDQVNVVRATYGGRAATLLFTRGDSAKPLP
jgi:hypothetical protein